MKFRRLSFGLVALAALALAAVELAGPAGPAAAQGTVAQAGASPVPASPGPRRGRRAPANPASSPTAAPSESPPPLQFTSLDGIWEVEEQPLGKRTVYSHLNLVQEQNRLTGYWEHGPKNVRSPLTGSFDGRLFSITIDLGGGQHATMSGYAENFSDFVGMFKGPTTSGDGNPFTAEHRKRERPSS